MYHEVLTNIEGQVCVCVCVRCVSPALLFHSFTLCVQREQEQVAERRGERRCLIHLFTQLPELLFTLAVILTSPGPQGPACEHFSLCDRRWLRPVEIRECFSETQSTVLPEVVTPALPFERRE